MTEFHACFSLGGFLYGLVGSYLAGLDPTSPRLSFVGIGLACPILIVLMSRFFLTKDELAPELDSGMALSGPVLSPQPSRWGWRIIILMVAFGTLVLGVATRESAVGDWGQEYIHRAKDSSISTAGIAISFFTGAEFLGRLMGDRITRYLGHARTVRCSGLFAVAGTILATHSSTAPSSILGFTLLGLGVSCITPLMISAAGRKDPVNSGRNVGIIMFMCYCGMLLGPAAFSYIISAFGIGHLFDLPLVLMLLLTVLGPISMSARAHSV